MKSNTKCLGISARTELQQIVVCKGGKKRGTGQSRV